MSFWIFLILSLVPPLSFAQVLIQAPGSDSASFQTYLASHPHLRSYSQTVATRLSKSVSNDEELFKLTDQNISNFSEFEQKLTVLRQTRALSEMGWSFLGDYLRIKRNIYEKQDKRSFQNLVCATEFFSDKEISPFCSWNKISLEKLNPLLLRFSILGLEAKALTLKDELRLPFEMELRWTLISDSYQEVSFWGRHSELAQRSLVFESLVQGSCSQFTTPLQDFTVLNSSQVFFSEGCVKGLATPPAPRESWAVRNRYWLIPVSIMVAGAAAYQLKDKNLVIEK